MFSSLEREEWRGMLSAEIRKVSKNFKRNLRKRVTVQNRRHYNRIMAIGQMQRALGVVMKVSSTGAIIESQGYLYKVIYVGTCVVQVQCLKTFRLKELNASAVAGASVVAVISQ